MLNVFLNPLEIGVITCFVIIALVLALIPFPKSKIENMDTREVELVEEIEKWRDQAELYFQDQDFIGFYGAVSKQQDAARKLLIVREEKRENA